MRVRGPRIVTIVVLGALVVTGTSVPAQAPAGRDVETALQRIGDFVERYYFQALSVVSEVRVRVRPMRRDMTPQGRPRRLLYEMRVEWEPAADDRPPEPVVRRDLLQANGRPPKPDDDPECSDPRLVSPEPLAMFLPTQQRDFSFTWAGRDRLAGRDAVILDYRARDDDPPSVEWTGPCVSVSLPGMTEGRVWADAENGGILRLDERLTGRFEFDVPPEQREIGTPRTMIIERADSTVRYRPVQFTDPDETLLLPASVEMMTVWRNAGTQRTFTTHEVSNYRRFATRSRVIGEPGRR